MQLLASALPGFRDLRAPLLAGYIWLLLLWIIIEPRFDERPTSGPVASILNLAEAVNPIWVGVAISLVAYLIGSVSQILSTVVKYVIRKMIRVGANAVGIAFMLGVYVIVYYAIWRHRIANRNMSTPAIPIDVSRHRIAESVAEKILRRPPSAEDNLELADLYGDGLTRLGEHEKRVQPNQGLDPLDFNRLQNQLESRYRSALSQLSSELSLPATLLVGDDSPLLFSETDRLKAEGELRLTVIPPIIALIVTAGISYSLYWLLLFLPVLIIAIQGMDREQQSRELIDSAIRQQKISPRSIENFRRFVESDRLLKDA